MTSSKLFLILVPSILALSLPQADAPQDQAQLGQLETRVAYTERDLERLLTLSPLPAPPLDSTNRFQADPRAARLGQALFFDTRFSADGSVSCATCHIPQEGWGDRRDRARGLDDVGRHTPTILNAVYNRWMFWDGRADSLWAQALHPFEERAEHGISRVGVLRRIFDDAEYREAFEAIFGALPPLGDSSRFAAEARPVADDEGHEHAQAWARMSTEDQALVNAAYANVGKAIAAFEAQIVSTEAPFDRYVEGLREGDAAKLEALDEAAVRGLQLFVGKARCVLCHNGPNLTDREFHSTRIPPLEGGGSRDAGRFTGIKLVQADPFNGAGEFSDDPDG
ncbi:MAG: cytochrome c peroxidase, partial [Planctomycetota bacterium]